MRSIRLFQGSHLLWTQPQRESRDGVRKMLRLRSADDWRRDPRFAEHPGKRNLSSRKAAFLGYLSHPVDNFAVNFFGLRVQALSELDSKE
jgi:hypothetical protein